MSVERHILVQRELSHIAMREGNSEEARAWRVKARSLIRWLRAERAWVRGDGPMQGLGA